MFSEVELTDTVLRAAQNLSIAQKADFLLETALSMINSGKYGEEVEHYLRTFLAVPGISQEQISKALIARGSARRRAADRLLIGAYQDYHAVTSMDPNNHEVLDQIRHDFIPPYSSQPVYRRVPLEIWELIASFTPKFYLRTWLFVSVFYRNIARRLIFRAIDIYFGDDHFSRGLDIFDRVKTDTHFAKLVKALRIHWSYEEGESLELLKRFLCEALPSFTALTEFEWIGYPEMKADMVQAVVSAHLNLKSLGLVGWHFDGVGVSGFKDLRQFTLRAEDDDGDADMGEVRAVLDCNQETLSHLTLGAYLMRNHSWDDAFRSATILKLTHLDLVDTHISHFVLMRIAVAQNLVSLTLHGTLERPFAAGLVFGSDHGVPAGQHTLLPNLRAFRFIMVGHDEETALFQNVVSFLRGRRQLRRLDLGECPWDMVKTLLPSLAGLRVLRIRIPKLNEQVAQLLVNSLSPCMTAIRLSVGTSDRSINTYARWFTRFNTLSMLHLSSAAVRRPGLNHSDRELYTWSAQAKSVPVALSSLDFLGWHGEHYVVVRDGQKHVTELKELPARRRLDSGKGVDLGSEDAWWLERKDIPIDFERPGLEG